MPRNVSIRFWAVIFIIIIGLGIRYAYWKIRLSNEGVYVIGLRIFLSTGGQIGTTYKYRFSYKSKSFVVGASSSLEKRINDSLLFIKILPSNPEIFCEFVIDTKVPSCLHLENVPEAGWLKLPKDTCN